MAKKKLHYSETVIYKSPPGVMAELRAVAYFRGQKGKLAVGAREIHMRGIKSFLESLTPSERKRFNEIFESVRMAESMATTSLSEVPAPAGVHGGRDPG